MTPWQSRVTDLTRRMADDMKVRNYYRRTIDAYPGRENNVRIAAGANSMPNATGY